jgi:hypothetical protein
MVALAYPKKFEVKRASGGGGFSDFGTFDSFYPGSLGYLSDVYGYGYDWMGYGAFGYAGFGVPYYYGVNGYYQPGGFYYATGGSAQADDQTHGQVVNGQGYTRVQPRQAYRGTAGNSGGSDQSSSSSGDGGGGSSSTSSSGGGASPGGYSGGGSSTGMTAVPR